MRTRAGKRLLAMEERQKTHWQRRRVDLCPLGDADLDILERLALGRQAWPGSLTDWLASLAPDDHDELLRLHALARWS
ncbi:MAG: hypothetical protein QM753_13170 [Thermomicrobiales bacterium]